MQGCAGVEVNSQEMYVKEPGAGLARPSEQNPENEATPDVLRKVQNSLEFVRFDFLARRRLTTRALKRYIDCILISRLNESMAFRTALSDSSGLAVRRCAVMNALLTACSRPLLFASGRMALSITPEHSD